MFLLVAASVGACGAHGGVCSSSESFSGAPLETLASNSGLLSVSVRTSPQPPARGVNAVEYTITTTDGGAAVPGLTLQVTPWMPYMGHGTSVTPEVTDEGRGIYDITCVDFPMPGTWQLQTAVSGPVHDDATVTLQIN